MNGARKQNILKARAIVHKIRTLQHISREDIADAVRNPEFSFEKILGIQYKYDYPGYFERFVETVYNKINLKQNEKSDTF